MDAIDINAIPNAPGEAPECRICGGGAEENAPLFYPCKCSGTIRYIHQACLTTWLKHKKGDKKCDVCKHPYIFTKVYAEDMPSRIPIIVFAKQVILQILATLMVGLRAWLVVWVWLIMVPYTTVWVVRFFFWSGDQIAWSVYGPAAPGENTLGRPNSTDAFQNMWNFLTSPSNVLNMARLNATLNVTSYVLEHPEDLAAREQLRRLAGDTKTNVVNDIVTGQMITAVAVMLCLAIFLLREWVIQNALGDDDPLAEVEGEPIVVDDVDEVGHPAAGQNARGPVVAVPLPALPGAAAAANADPVRLPLFEEHDIIPPAHRLEIAGPAGADDGGDDGEDAGGRVVMVPPLALPNDAAVNNVDAFRWLPRSRERDTNPPALRPSEVASRPGIDDDEDDDNVPPSGTNGFIPLPRVSETSRLYAVPRSEVAQMTAGVSFSASRPPRLPQFPQEQYDVVPGEASGTIGEQRYPTPSNSPLKPFPPNSVSTVNLGVPESSSSTEFELPHQNENSAAVPQSALANNQLKDGAFRFAIPSRFPAPGPSVVRPTQLREVQPKHDVPHLTEEPSIFDRDLLPREATERRRRHSRIVLDEGVPAKKRKELASLEREEARASKPIEQELAGLDFGHYFSSNANTVPSTVNGDTRLSPGQSKRKPGPMESSSRLPPQGWNGNGSSLTDRKGKGKLGEPAIPPAIRDFDFSPTLPASSAEKSATFLSPADYNSQPAPTFSTFSFSPSLLRRGANGAEPQITEQPRGYREISVQEGSSSLPSTLGPPSEKARSGGLPMDFSFSFSVPKMPENSAQLPAQFASKDSVFTFDESKPFQSISDDSQSFAGPSSANWSSRRPALPPTTPNGGLPSPTPRPPLIAVPAPQVIPSRVHGAAGSNSPHLATYLAPEQIDGQNDNYFNGGEWDNPDTELPHVDERRIPDWAENVMAQVVQPYADDDDDDPRVPGAFRNEPEVVLGDERMLDDRPEEVAQPLFALDFDLDGDAADQVLLEDDPDGDVIDEVEGAMEAVGMRGPLIVLFQNVLLVMVLLYFTMAIGLWIPYIVGKTSGLITLRPRSGVHLLNFPLRAVRLFTDPLIDFLLLAIRGVILPVLQFTISMTGLSSTRPTKGARVKFDLPTGLGRRVAEFFHRQSSMLLAGKYRRAGVGSAGALVERFFRSPWGARLQELGFSIATETIRKSGDLLRLWVARWESLVRGDGPQERAFAVTFGYCITVVTLGVALESSGPNLGTVARFARSLIRQQVIVLKVAVFICVELVMFPLGCGVLLDFNALPLFPAGTFEARMAFLRYSPVTCIFLHWMLGTMFMYQFAVLLSSCRSVMRGGAMWFIKDPADPNFHPIRDILDRPVLAQLRKLFSSAMMYVAVLTIGIGSALFAIRQQKIGLLRFPLLPLRTNMMDPLSEIPIDLLCLHIVVPVTLNNLRPRAALSYVMERWWKMAAKYLRLSSYMFGATEAEEESFDSRGPMTRLLDWVSRTSSGERVFQGGFVRAPALDTLILLPEEDAFIPVNRYGEPFDERGEELKRTQDEACRRTGATPETSFAIVYIPPWFKLRLILFTLSLWLYSVFVALICVAAPIHIGRGFIHALGHQPVHDGYAWTIGLYILLGCSLLYKEVKRLQRKRPTPQRFAKKLLIKGSQVLYMAFMIGVVMPILIALVIDTHLILPVRIWLGYTAKPEIHLVETWTCGLLLAKIGMKAARMDPHNQFYQSFLKILQDGYRTPDARRATETLILPICAPLLVMVFLPSVMMQYTRPYNPSYLQDELAALRYIHPGVFGLSALIAASRGIYRTFRRWTQTIRDAKYLVELRLTNLEDQQGNPARHAPLV